jgi:streptogramin lyase
MREVLGAAAGFLLATLVPAAVSAAPVAPGDLLLTCPYWGVTRIDPGTGEQKPLGVGNSLGMSPLTVDEDGLVWVVDNRWVVSVDSETGETRLVLQLPEDFIDSNDGELLAEPGGTLLYAGDGVLSRIDPATGDMTPVASGTPLITPLGLDFAPNGDVWIADYNAGIFRWNEEDGVTPVSSGDLLVGPNRVRQLADGDLFVTRVGLPLRVDPDTGDQSVYAAALGAIGAVDVASNGDLVYAYVGTPSTPQIRRVSGPAAQPVTLLEAGPTRDVLSLPNLTLTPDDRVVIAGVRQEFQDSVNVFDQPALWLLDGLSLRVLSARPPPGAITTSADGRLYVATTAGSAFHLSELDPRRGATHRISTAGLIDRPVDAVVEANGDVLVMNGIPNGTPSVLRVDRETGGQSLLTPTGQLTDPERITVTPNGNVYIGDANATKLFEVDPVSGEQTPVPGAGSLSFWGDLEAEAGGTLLVLQQAVDHLVRLTPDTGAQQEVGPPIGPFLEIGVDPGPNSALAIDLAGTPWVTLGSSTAIDALYRAPLGAEEIELVSALPLCSGPDLEVVRAPEPGPAGWLAALAGLARLARARRLRVGARARRARAGGRSPR